MSANTDPWSSGGLPLLNVAETCVATRALGPGLRSVLWVQGCGLTCPGCIAPNWIPRRIARLATPAQLVGELLADPAITGLTFSGGEPMLQAVGLAQLARLARTIRQLDIICFTGLTIERLRRSPPGLGVAELLAQLDLLIDGPYVAAANDDQGMRGSSNQRFVYLTERLRGSAQALEFGPRRAELRIRDGETVLVGVPPHGLLEAFHQAFPE